MGPRVRRRARPDEGGTRDVTAVCILSDGRVVSGSMDKSIKIFDPSKAFECVETFDDAHDSSVLALVALPDAFGGGFLSGSADATIRAWKNASADDGAVFGRHADTVRGLALNATANLVLSASHDTTARAWTPRVTSSRRTAGTARWCTPSRPARAVPGSSRAAKTTPLGCGSRRRASARRWYLTRAACGPWRTRRRRREREEEEEEEKRGTARTSGIS